MNEVFNLWTLFAGSFLAATLLPGGSEVLLFGVLKADARLFWPALGVATIGNTLGGMSSYLIGRVIPQRSESKALQRLRRHGAVMLLCSWVPFIGDPLCVAAGWLRLDPWLSAAFIAAGKFARYFLVAFFAL